MALNKFMHPRNIYKNPPDFRELAKKYEEFSKVAKTDVSGKVSIDFKNPHALRILTKCLLKSDFNLDVKIPEDRLVPTLPLRLNYILWIEDLLSCIGPCDFVRGIDIGTGACAIYPLLAAVKNKWLMVGTETDGESYNNAIENVTNNKLENLIELRKNSTNTTIEHLFDDDNSLIYQFTMCNPPFYTNIQELWESRSPARPPPKNGFTGSPQELITEGGELQFCRQIIEESKKVKDKILIFTTMVGHKYNLKELIIDLKAEGIKHATTEFCQGRITRWGLAWTFQDYDFSKIELHIDKSKKKSSTIVFSLPEIEGVENSFDNIYTKTKEILQNLHLTYKIITKRNNEIVLDIMAMSNTWSNQRRKRRLMKRMCETGAKKPKANDVSALAAHIESSQSATTNNEKRKDKLQEKIELNNTSEESKGELSNPGTTNEPVVHSIMKIQYKSRDSFIEMEFISGSAGKEGLHQIIQYIKNNWK
ncbi:U6 small nuclear RNA (adenine-(43)-N(6))-methyltransferase [Aricia agestis]|uniref:U6 small nuclear RNA (adenine-(43)-N(6))-methyltransferase n=1 Tax=Aricia agestis TaxID=91739 RepID=UPI001C2051B4|nr:U6 small nuclear RNA (adenine-(43)-N(6))-methyltransferase [Aricia agestis]